MPRTVPAASSDRQVSSRPAWQRPTDEDREFLRWQLAHANVSVPQAGASPKWNLAQPPHRLPGRYGTEAFIPDSHQDAHLRIRFRRTGRAHDTDRGSEGMNRACRHPAPEAEAGSLTGN